MDQQAFSIRAVPVMALAILICWVTAQGKTDDHQCQEISTSLVALSKRTGGEEKVLARLFNVGDDCIDDLFALLNGTDFVVSPRSKAFGIWATQKA